MQGLIRLLPDALANQIAAGEVVQRPASVVKELMENSVDAGATRIELIVARYGKSLIQVVDDGKGMSEVDARMSFERHATSKINSADDLFRIRTMGFRGEALASIAAVSQVEMKSRKVEEELGTCISIEASEVKWQEPCALEPGTSISVRNLFYNVPARRNFLKSDSVEMKHIIDEFQRVSLAHPGLSFRLEQDGKTLFDLRPGKLSNRITEMLGRNFKGQFMACQAETELVKLTGYIGRPESAKKSRGDQFLFVNNRYIRSSYLHHAILTAYEDLIPEKYHPFYALFLEMDPAHLDINVHPTKTEIKFDDERSIYAIVRSAVKQALGAHNIYPTLDFSADVNIMKQFEQRGEKKNYGEFDGPDLRKNPGNLKNWDKLFDENLEKDSDERQRIIRSESEGDSVMRGSRMNEEQDRDAPRGSNFMQLYNRYILSPVKSGLMLIDQVAATERIIYERMKTQAEGRGVVSQRCLFPERIEFTAGDMQLLDELKEDLIQLGFELEPFGKNTVVINGIPADIALENEKELIESVLEQYKHSKNDLELTIREKLLRSLAQRTALNNRRQLDVTEMEELVNRLFSCENGNYTPGGKQTFKIIERATLENFFK